MKILTLFTLIFFSLQLMAKPIVVGSKKFTESVILGEAMRLLLKSQDLEAKHKAELGGTRILWNALVSGDIDIYPEYSGTIEEELLKKKTTDLSEIRTALKKDGIGVSEALGFNNTYAIGMKRTRAQELGIDSISDLKNFPDLKIGWSSEFRQRQDGWPGLKATYQLPHKFIRGLDHDVAYRALGQGDIDVIDLYSTDAEIQYYDILILKDDKDYFPKYEALFLYRLDKEEVLMPALLALSGTISDEKMSSLNRQAKIDKKSSTEVAAGLLKEILDAEVTFKVSGRKDRILLRSLEHFKLVGVSLLFAILVAIPLGIIVAKSKKFGQLILMIVSAIQTIPALALLVMMIKPLSMIGLSGIGDTPAYIALFLYSLLPIVRNTYSGMEQIPMGLQETAAVFNLSPSTRLLKIELPLAMPAILTGIKTSLVMNIGFATLGALVGAGGFGQPILTGIRLDDYGMILEGAIPAAILALLAQKIFDWMERFLISPGLRI